MSDPKEINAPKDDLDLEPKIVQDLEPEDKDAEEVRGGVFVVGKTAFSCLCK